MTGASYHAAHLSTAAAVEAIRGAKARGLPVTCDTQPAYFALNETAVGDYRTFAKLSPPLRSEADRQAIAAAVADGTIDCVASDHAPHDQESKRVPFAHAAPGIIGLETLLPLTLQLYHKGQGRLIDLLRRVTSAPADLLLFDLDRPGRIEVDRSRSKSKNSPFDGDPIQGRVLRSVVDGRTVFAAAD
jgi:dihydroorotase